MSNKISMERKGLYYIGLSLMALGFILFLSSFFMAEAPMFAPGPPPFFQRAKIGMICIILGGILTNIGAKGTAGSGLILDPEKAREDLKPFSAAKGRMINDVVDQIDLAKGINLQNHELKVKEVIKVKCRDCEALNDEDARFCKSCGQGL